MRITLPFLSALPLLALLCVSCVNRGYNGATTKHTPGQITRASKGPLWISVEPERAKAIIADQESNPRFPTEFYQQQAPVVQRLQKWVDVIHAELKRRYPEQLSMVPEPQVLIQNQDAINAYVPIFQAYFPLPVAHLDAPRRLRGTEGAMIIFQPYSGKVITYGTEDALKYSLEFMVPMPRDDGLIKNFVEYYADEQAKGEPSRNLCRISYDGKQIALQGRCTTSGMENFERARRFGVAVTPNVLVIHSSLLRLSGSEEEFMRVICHELGHFYRAHTTTPPSRTSYLYARGPRNSPRAPAVTTDLILLELGAKARALLGLTNSLPVAGATLPSALFYQLRRSENESKLRLELNCASTACRNKWAAVNALTDGHDPEMLALFYSEFVDAGKEGKYLQMENAWIDALRETPFTAESIWSPLDVAESLLPDSLLEINGEKITSTPWKNAFELIQFEASAYMSLMGESESVRKALDTKGLDLYTEEQEADDLSLEILSYIGVPVAKASEQMARTWTTFLDAEERKRCLQVRKQKWQENGKPALISMGSWSDSHHDLCFRIFNLEREIDAHAYKLAPRPSTLTFAEDWKTFVKKEANWGKPLSPN